MDRTRKRPFGEHSEVFWILFVLASAAVFAAVVEPARREAESARRRVEAADAELEARRARLEAKRRERQALESGNPEAWKAAWYLNGLVLPGSRLTGGPRVAPPRTER